MLFLWSSGSHVDQLTSFPPFIRGPAFGLLMVLCWNHFCKPLSISSRAEERTLSYIPGGFHGLYSSFRSENGCLKRSLHCDWSFRVSACRCQPEPDRQRER